MIDARIARRSPCRAASLLVALIAAVALAQSGLARAQAAGGLAIGAQQIAAFLAAGGALADLCDSGEPHGSGAVQCDLCCLVVAAPLPAAPLPVVALWRLAGPRGLPPRRADTPVAWMPCGPPVRAPPAHAV